MLTTVQKTGTGVPLFVVHGVAGIMTLSSTIARALGPDHPFYVFHANGMDGTSTQPLINNMPDLVRVYVEAIQNARPSGRVALAGMCEGSLAVMEIATALEWKGRELGPVILLDPQPVPPGYDRRNYEVDVSDPAVARNLIRRAREALLGHAAQPYNDMPFDANDERQLETAAAAAVASLTAFGRHVPQPYSGPTHLILSAERASDFFHPQTPWRDLLRGPRTIHVLPIDHQELFRSGREHFARALKFMVTEPSGKLAEREAVSA
jgi:thioesterase domain-containing protein